MALIHTTSKGVEIHAFPGKKSPHDFVVRYQEPGKRMRTPQHIHLVVDLFAKLSGERALTLELLDHILGQLIAEVQPATAFPPQLRRFQQRDADRFMALDNFGEYDVEFLLVVTELIMIQENTNYPYGTANRRLFRAFREGADIFSLVSMATWNRRRR